MVAFDNENPADTRRRHHRHKRNGFRLRIDFGQDGCSGESSGLQYALGIGDYRFDCEGAAGGIHRRADPRNRPLEQFAARLYRDPDRLTFGDLTSVSLGQTGYQYDGIVHYQREQRGGRGLPDDLSLRHHLLGYHEARLLHLGEGLLFPLIAGRACWFGNNDFRVAQPLPCGSQQRSLVARHRDGRSGIEHGLIVIGPSYLVVGFQLFQVVLRNYILAEKLA